MSEMSDANEDLFVVRIRRDVPADTLRGYVDDVSHGERLYFTVFRDLTAFLQTRIDRRA